MERRGLEDMGKDYLFVLDGSKALRSAVAKKFGKDVLVQRCQQHKRRNVRDHLPPESCFSVTRTIIGRVKRWSGGDMVQRWAVAALIRAEKKFKRVKGYREIPKLIAALG